MSERVRITFLYRRQQRVAWADDPGYQHRVLQQRCTVRDVMPPVIEYLVLRDPPDVPHPISQWALEGDLVAL